MVPVHLSFCFNEIPQTLFAESSNLIPLAKTFSSVSVCRSVGKNPGCPHPFWFRKRRYATAGPYGSSTGKSPPVLRTNARPTTNPPCCSSLPPPSQTTFCRSSLLRDPFILEFLNLKDEYSESDMSEDALLSHPDDLTLELGDDFAFVGRQRRLRIDDSRFRVDLLFFHRRCAACCSLT